MSERRSLSLAEAGELVTELWRSLRWDEAESVCRQLLAQVPEEVNALHVLGAIAVERGRFDEGIALLERAQAVLPGEPGLAYSLALALFRGGRLAEALAGFDRVLALAPGHVASWNNRGNVLRALGRLDEAEAAWRRAIELAPDHSGACSNLGRLIRDKHRQESEQLLLRALSLLEHDSEQNEADRSNEAAMILGALGRQEAAEAAFRACLAQNPRHAQAWQGLAGLLSDEDGREAEAEAAWRQAIAAQPGLATAQAGLAALLARTGRQDEALALYRQALAHTPGHAELAYGFARLLLAMGRLEEGWPLYLGRRGLGVMQHLRRQQYHQPLWQGEPVDRLVIWGEEGIADELWFSSLLPEAVARAGGNVLFQCDPRIAPLMARSFPGVAVLPRAAGPHAEALAASAQTPLQQLAELLRSDPTRFSRQPRSWLAADPARVEELRLWLAGLPPGLRVGFSWRSRRYKDDAIGRAYPTMEHWRALAGLPGVVWVSLQYDDPDADLAALRAAGLAIHEPPVDLMNDQEGIAALTRAVDLCIGPANAPVVLAAALGAPTWMLWSDHLRVAWRLHGLDDACPWLPGVRLFRHRRGAPWPEVLAGLREALAGAGSPAPAPARAR